MFDEIKSVPCELTYALQRLTRCPRLAAKIDAASNAHKCGVKLWRAMPIGRTTIMKIDLMISASMIAYENGDMAVAIGIALRASKN